MTLYSFANLTLAGADRPCKELLVLHGTVEGGSISLGDGIKAAAMGRAPAIFRIPK